MSFFLLIIRDTKLNNRNFYILGRLNTILIRAQYPKRLAELVVWLEWGEHTMPKMTGVWLTMWYELAMLRRNKDIQFLSNLTCRFWIYHPIGSHTWRPSHEMNIKFGVHGSSYPKNVCPHSHLVLLCLVDSRVILHASNEIFAHYNGRIVKVAETLIARTDKDA